MIIEKATKFLRLKSPLELFGLGGILFVLLLHTGLCMHVGLSLPEALYETLLLYVVHADLNIGKGVHVDEKWISLAFWFCRFAAPILTVSGFIDIFYTFVRPMRIRKNIKNHIVIAGMGKLGTRIHKAILHNGIKNDIVIVDKALPETNTANTRQSTFYRADLLDEETYAAAHMNKAHSIWVTTSDDNDNLAITSNILASLNYNNPKIFVHLYEHALINNFQTFFNNNAKNQISFFNIYDEIIKGYLSEWADKKLDNLIIIGIGKFGRSALRGILNKSKQYPAKISIIDRRASDMLGKLNIDIKNNTALFDILSTPLYNLETMNKIKELLLAPGKTLMIVCTDQDLLNLSFACHIVDFLNAESRVIVKLSSKPAYIDEQFNKKMRFLDSSAETAIVLAAMVKNEMKKGH